MIKQFISLKKKQPKKGKWALVTNDIQTLNHDGEIANLWLTNDIVFNGHEYYIYDDCNETVDNLTHWKYVFEDEK